MSNLALHEALRGRLTDQESVMRYIEAGNATLTIASLLTTDRFTFKFSRPRENEVRGEVKPIWVKVLTGSDNTSDYSFVGTIWPEQDSYRYAHSRSKSRIGEEAPSVKALMWFLRFIRVRPERVFQQANIWHEGTCGRCGRKLTVPSSISTGFGPECAGKVGL